VASVPGKLGLVLRRQARARFGIASLPSDPKGGWVARRLAFSPDGKFLVGGHANGAFRVWDLVQRKEVKGLKEASGDIEALAFAPDGATLVVASNRTLRLFHFADRAQRGAIEAPSSTRRAS
jgi:WD40 repeat protein